MVNCRRARLEENIRLSAAVCILTRIIRSAATESRLLLLSLSGIAPCCRLPTQATGSLCLLSVPAESPHRLRRSCPRLSFDSNSSCLPLKQSADAPSGNAIPASELLVCLRSLRRLSSHFPGYSDAHALLGVSGLPCYRCGKCGTSRIPDCAASTARLASAPSGRCVSERH